MDDHLDDQIPGDVAPTGIDEAPAIEERTDPGRGWMGWAISATVHATVIATLAMVVHAVRDQDPGEPMITPLAPTVEKLVRPEPKRDRLAAEQPRDLPPVDDVPDAPTPTPVVASQPDPQPDSPTDESLNPDNVKMGEPQAITETLAGGIGVFLAIGAGGPPAGMVGDGGRGHRVRKAPTRGATKGSQASVDAALRWLKRHQSPDGRWDAVNYPANCDLAGRCEPGKLAAGDTNLALTGYAVMCFLGRGYDHRSSSTFRPVVKKGIEALLAAQKADGTLGERNYEHAIATYALADAFGMTGDPALRAPAQKAVDVLLKRQNRIGAGGSDGMMAWDYVGPGDRNDSSVSGWATMALKSAHGAGLATGDGLAGARRWLETTWKAYNPGWQKLDPYTGTSVFPYVHATSAGGAAVDKGNRTTLASVGMVASVFLGTWKTEPVMMQTLGNWVLANQLPRGWPTNTYYLYYNTIGMFQLQGEHWRKWNAATRDLLVGAQRRGEDCFDGSWDWQGTEFHGNDVGRVLSTVYCTLSLEVYYRDDLVIKAKR